MTTVLRLLQTELEKTPTDIKLGALQSQLENVDLYSDNPASQLIKTAAACLVSADIAIREEESRLNTEDAIPTRVKVLDENLCKIHGWSVGSTHDVTHLTDEEYYRMGGQCVTVMSLTWKHDICLAPGQYETIE